MSEGMIFDIQRFSVHDGPGIRTTVFLKGCPLRCAWCHNPEGLSHDAQVQFMKEKCIGCHRCEDKRDEQAAARCPTGALTVCGKRMSVDQVVSEALKDKNFYSPLGGVTFSGGECLMQADFVAQALVQLKSHGIHTAIDTSGAVPWQSIEKTLPYCDLYLYDLKCADSALHRRYTGMGNERILENLHRLAEYNVPIWIRVPIIPDVNDSDAEIEAIAAIVSQYPAVQKVTLMPYHTLGMNKYELLGMSVPYRTDKKISEQQLSHLKQIFNAHGVATD